MASHPIYQFYAELKGFKPKIWRRFQVMNNITVARFGYINQILFEMKASHLMKIEVPESENFNAYIKSRHPDKELPDGIIDNSNAILCYEMPIAWEDIHLPLHRNIKLKDATEEMLCNAVRGANETLDFFYDFGDGWQLSIVLEKVFDDKNIPGKELPRVLEGEGYGIIEDVGGIWGLTEFVEAFKKKKGGHYKELCEWAEFIGLDISTFDISAFDFDDMNFRLKKLPRIYQDIYEYDLEPTKASINLLERKYLKKP
jgi:hypothetical protein